MHPFNLEEAYTALFSLALAHELNISGRTTAVLRDRLESSPNIHGVLYVPPVLCCAPPSLTHRAIN